jgi:uncharacterized protein (TIGR02117 family)
LNFVASIAAPPPKQARWILIILLLACACARPFAELPSSEAGGKTKSIFVVNYGWHSALVIKKTDISEGVMPEVKDFSDAEYLEVGWGDWDYYQASDPGLRLALKAAFWSSRSVLHVAGFKGAVENYFRGSETVEIVLGEKAHHRLIQFLSDTFSRPAGAAPLETRPGLYANSRFYPATGKFHLFRNCNTWVAEALRSAGLPISTASAFTAGNLSHQVKQLGAVIK